MDRETQTSRKKALVIAVSSYDNMDERFQLEFCKDDGNKVCQTLEKLGYEIPENNKIIGHVKWDIMRDVLADFFTQQEIKTRDTLLFYFSGHGMVHDDMLYLATSEIDPDAPYRRGIDQQYLKTLINDSISKKIILIIDSCHSGKLTPFSMSDDQSASSIATSTVDKINMGEGRFLLASCKGYQQSFGTSKGSKFTQYVIDGLNGNKDSVNKDGFVTPESLAKYVDDEMLSHHKKDEPVQRLIKKIEGSGDIVLAEYPNLIQHPLESINKLKKPIDFSRFITIRNQGEDISGLAFAVVYAMEISLAQIGDMSHLSARYIYEKSKTKDEIPDVDAMKAKSLSYVVQEFGTVPESVWPYQPNNRSLPAGKTWKDLDTLAANYKARIFYLTSFDDIFSHLINGRAIVIGHPVFRNFSDPNICDGTLYHDKKFVTPMTDEIIEGQAIGYHLSTIIGFEPEESLFKCTNAWGVGWGSNGFFYIKDNDARRIIDVDDSFAVDMKKQPMNWK